MALSAKNVGVGDVRTAELVHELTRSQIVMYAGASGDFNPLHTDEVYATQVAGFPSVFAHGMLTMGMTGRVLTDWIGDGRLLGFGCRFVRQVWPGDSLTATATIVGVREETAGPIADFEVVTSNHRGETVLTGTASGRLDR